MPTMPTLTRRLMLLRLSKVLPQFPAELIKAGLEEIIASMAAAIQGERPLILRGFGRWELRRYQNCRKKTGLIFKPSPALLTRLNTKK